MRKVVAATYLCLASSERVIHGFDGVHGISFFAFFCGAYVWVGLRFFFFFLRLRRLWPTFFHFLWVLWGPVMQHIWHVRPRRNWRIIGDGREMFIVRCFYFCVVFVVISPVLFWSQASLFGT